MINGTTYGATIDSYTKQETDALLESIASTRGSITLTTDWISSGSIYYQEVNIANVTVNSKIDLQLSLSNISQLTYDKTSALVAENNNGRIIIYAIGQAPSVVMTVQYTKTEVIS